ncbi:MAG: DUF1844 domain-containing protein [Thermodesulfovibrionales bacterium]
MSQENSFKIRDKRRLNSEGVIKNEYIEKQNIEKEKEQPKSKIEAFPSSELDFISFLMNLSGMAYNAMDMGSSLREDNLRETKYIIDAIGILEEKTRGNLTPQEERTLQSILYELRMNYIRLMEELTT